MLKPDIIIITVCEKLNLDPDKLRSETKKTEYIDGRFLAYYFIHKSFYPKKIGWKELAGILGRKQHGSAMNAIKKCNNFLQSKDIRFKRKFDQINEVLKIV